MSRVHFARVLFVLLSLVASTPMLQAQAWEAYAFAGGTTHGGNVNFNDAFDTRVRMPGAFTTGGKVGGFITENFSFDGNLSWYNHMFRLSNRSDVVIFQPITNTTAGIAGLTGNEVKTRALLWEMSGNYDFGEHTLGTRWTPYVTLGVGGMTARIKNANEVLIAGGGFIRNPLYLNTASAVQPFVANPVTAKILDNNDTFFTFSYGGGVKAFRVAGPVGFRVDVRGRTLPNFFGESNTWAEFTGGLVFAWGER